MKEQALIWWDTLTIRQKWDLFYENNPLIAAAPANIGLDIKMVEPDHIVEIYNNEQSKLSDNKCKVCGYKLPEHDSMCSEKIENSDTYQYQYIQTDDDDNYYDDNYYNDRDVYYNDNDIFDPY